MFAEWGVPVLDLDAVGRELTRRGRPGLERLRRAFGDWILDAQGDLDRARLGAYCFASAERTRRLNRILHPLIWQVEEEWVRRQRAAYAIIEAPVLLESGAAGRMDAVVVVLADLALRRRRLRGRPGMSDRRFEAIVARQCDDAERRRRADFILDNNGGLTELRRQVRAVHRQLRQRFAARGAPPSP